MASSPLEVRRSHDLPVVAAAVNQQHIWNRSLGSSGSIRAAIIVPSVAVVVVVIIVAVIVLLRSRSRILKRNSTMTDPELLFNIPTLTSGGKPPRHRPPPLILQLGMLPSEAPPTAKETPIIDITFLDVKPPREPSRSPKFSRFSLRRAKSYSSSFREEISEPPPARLAPDTRPPDYHSMNFPRRIEIVHDQPEFGDADSVTGQMRQTYEFHGSNRPFISTSHTVISSSQSFVDFS